MNHASIERIATALGKSTDWMMDMPDGNNVLDECKAVEIICEFTGLSLGAAQKLVEWKKWGMNNGLDALSVLIEKEAESQILWHIYAVMYGYSYCKSLAGKREDVLEDALETLETVGEWLNRLPECAAKLCDDKKAIELFDALQTKRKAGASDGTKNGNT